MEEAVIAALVATLGTAGLSEALARAFVQFVGDRFRADPDAARRAVLVAGLGTLGLMVVAALTASLYFNADRIVAAFSRLIAQPTATGRMLLTLGGVCTGILLFFFRKYARVGYGALELLVSIIGIAGFPLDGSVGQIPWLVSLSGLIYIFVRGLDNIDVGLASRRKAAKRATASLSAIPG